MSFAPFDTSLIVERLVTQLPALHFVGGAADYAAVKELRGFRTPSAERSIRNKRCCLYH